MITTIKISKETKERLMSLELTEKGKTFDMVVNDLITFYNKNSKNYVKDYKKWKQSFKNHGEEMKEYQNRLGQHNKQKETWERLLKWAKSKGFKP